MSLEGFISSILFQFYGERLAKEELEETEDVKIEDTIIETIKYADDSGSIGEGTVNSTRCFRRADKNRNKLWIDVDKSKLMIIPRIEEPVENQELESDD